MNVTEAVLSRRSIRAFRDTPVPLETLRRVLENARFAPSGCNYQPWEAVVLTGEPLKALQEVLLSAQPDEPLEYRYDRPAVSEKHQARLFGLGAAMYGARGSNGPTRPRATNSPARTCCRSVLRCCCCATFPSSWASRSGRTSACGCKPSCCC